MVSPARWSRWSVVAAALFAAVPMSGCSEEEPPPRAELPVVEPIPRTPVAAPRSIAGPAAFDLIAATDGATLVWGAPSERGGGIYLVPLDRQGAAMGGEQSVHVPELPTQGDALTRIAPEAVEVSAASGAGRMGIAWLSRLSAQYRVLAVQGDADGSRFGPARTLSRLTSVPHGRGHVVVAGSGAGDLRVLYESGRGRCSRGRGRCARFSVRGLGRTGGRRGVPLSVRQPCTMPITGFAFTGGSWYYGICAIEDDRPETTVFAIQFDPAYAHSETVLPGCAPAGLVPLPDGVAPVATCDGTPTAARIRDAGRQPMDVGPVASAIGCDGSRPVLRAGEGGALTLTLDAPAERIEALLPAARAPEGSRAVWTGEALLVAVPLGPEVSIQRYACEDGELLRTNLP